MALSLLPPDTNTANPTVFDQVPEQVSRLLPQHLLVMGAACVLLLLISRLRLRALLRQG